MPAASDGKAYLDEIDNGPQELIAISSETERRDEQSDRQRIKRKATPYGPGYTALVNMKLSAHAARRNWTRRSLHKVDRVEVCRLEVASQMDINTETRRC